MSRPQNPPPLSAAASLVAVQGLVLGALAVVEIAHIVPARASVAISTSVFFAVYGALLIVGAYALTRQAPWARGPVLLTQLIALGLAWNLRDHALVAVVLAIAALLTIAGMLHPDSIEVLADRPEE